MVDFNAEGAFSANKAHILELIILGRRDELLNTFQLWREHKLSQSAREEGTKYKLRAVLFTLFLELDRAIFRKLSKKDKKGVVTELERYVELKEMVLSDDEVTDEELINMFFSINNVLDDLNLIKIDTKRAYDTTMVENENDEKGL